MGQSCLGQVVQTKSYLGQAHRIITIVKIIIITITIKMGIIIAIIIKIITQDPVLVRPVWGGPRRGRPRRVDNSKGGGTKGKKVGF